MGEVPAMAPRHSDIDIYSDDVLADPYPTYKKLRDLSAAVYLEAWDLYFVGRYEDVRAALHDWETFSSAKGIGLKRVWQSPRPHAFRG